MDNVEQDDPDPGRTQTQKQHLCTEKRPKKTRKCELYKHNLNIDCMQGLMTLLDNATAAVALHAIEILTMIISVPGTDSVPVLDGPMALRIMATSAVMDPLLGFTVMHYVENPTSDLEIVALQGQLFIMKLLSTQRRQWMLRLGDLG